MRILVTGGAGFVGRHLISHLAGRGHEITAFDQAFPSPATGATCVTGDLRDAQTVTEIIRSLRPDACVHLGAISFVPAGNSHPDVMLAVNILGTINILEAIRAHAPSSRTLVVSTAQVYLPRSDGKPIAESEPLLPVTLYGISKAAADSAALACARQNGLPIMTARPNNHTGPGQSPQFAVAAFVKQVKAIRDGQAEPLIRVGNLDSRRDICDVRDVVRAYRLLLETGHSGQSYNISGHNMIRMKDVLDELCRLAGVQPRIEVDPARYRPADFSPNLDVSRIMEETGWQPEISLSQTLRDMLDDKPGYP